MGLGAWLVRAYCHGRHYRGKIHVARLLGRVLLPHAGGEYTLADGTRMYLHPRDWIEYRLLQRGDYEPVTIEFLKRNLAAGQTSVFAGVNIGLHVIAASQAVGAKGCVVGIEPQPASLIRARANILLNDLPDNVRLVSAGLGAKSDILPMSPAPSHNSGMASLVDSGSGRCPFQICVSPLPVVLRELGIGGSDLMLLDVEGFELEVLRGIERDSAPGILVVETKGQHLEKAGATEKELFERLGELGYRCFDLHGRPVKAGEEVVEFNVVGVLEGWQAEFVLCD